jgi:hypothetical protein
MEMAPPNSGLKSFLAARAVMTPCPKPKSKISCGLKPHFEMSPASITSEAGDRIYIPRTLVYEQAVTQWKPSGSGRGRHVGPCKVMQNVSGKFGARANEDKLLDMSPRPQRKSTAYGGLGVL